METVQLVNSGVSCNINMIEFLSESLKYIDNVTPTYINKGGCGVFAAMVYDKLKEFGIQVDIYAIGRFNLTTSESFKMWQMGRMDKVIAGIDHVVLMYNGMFFDSNGYAAGWVNTAEVKLRLTRNQLQELVNESSIWRKVFDRDLIPFIEERIDTIFNGVCNYNPGMYPVKQDIKLTSNTVRAEDDEWESMFY